MQPNPVPTPAMLEIPPLLPAFLRRRRVGAPVVPTLLEETGLERPPLFLLVQIDLVAGSYGEENITLSQLRAYSPYAVIDTFSAPLGVLITRDFVRQSPDGRLSLAPEAAEIVRRLNTEASAYVGTLTPLSPSELERLDNDLHAAVETMAAGPTLAPQRGSHLAGALYLRRYLAPGARPLSRIEQSVVELWSARDDAHTSAWRELMMEGPALDALTAIWQGAATVPDLNAALAGKQTPLDVESSLMWLVERDFAARDDDRVWLTPAGVLKRDDIERETNHRYFAGWPHPEGETEWVRDTLSALVQGLQ